MGRIKGSGDYIPQPGDKFKAFEGRREARNQPTVCTSVTIEVVNGTDSIGEERTFIKTRWSFEKVEDTK